MYWRLDNDIPSARFLSEEDKPKAVERLRANQTGTGSREFKWGHVREMLLEPKTWLWVALSIFINAGASVTNTFGPLILNGLGFDKCETSSSLSFSSVFSREFIFFFPFQTTFAT